MPQTMDVLRILAATDFSPPSGVACERAALLAREHGAALTLMHVVPGDALEEARRWLAEERVLEQELHDEARQRLAQLADALRCRWHVAPATVHAIGSVVDDLLIESSNLDAALILVGAHGSGGPRRLVLGTTAERLLRRTARPVLVVRTPVREPYRRVLIAVDFSPWSSRLVDLARAVAPRAQWQLLHAFGVPFKEKLRRSGVRAETIDVYRARARADALRRLRALAQDVGMASDEWQPCVAEGNAWQVIVEHERQQACDLVVLGKHGRSAAEDLLLGSVTRRVLGEGSADVLVSTEHGA